MSSDLQIQHHCSNGLIKGLGPIVFDAILTSGQTSVKLQCLNENLMLNNFRRTAVLKKNINCELKLHSYGLYQKKKRALNELET